MTSQETNPLNIIITFIVGVDTLNRTYNYVSFTYIYNIFVLYMCQLIIFEIHECFSSFYNVCPHPLNYFFDSKYVPENRLDK